MALSQRAQEALDRLREAYGRDFTIKSGYRSPTENRAVGGASGSQHVHGNAFDISTKGWTDTERRDFLDAAVDAGFKGVGVYPTGSIHIDVRETPAVWGVGGKYSGKNVPTSAWQDWAQPTIARLRGQPVPAAPVAPVLPVREPPPRPEIPATAMAALDEVAGVPTNGLLGYAPPIPGVPDSVLTGVPANVLDPTTLPTEIARNPFDTPSMPPMEPPRVVDPSPMMPSVAPVSSLTDGGLLSTAPDNWPGGPDLRAEDKPFNMSGIGGAVLGGLLGTLVGGPMAGMLGATLGKKVGGSMFGPSGEWRDVGDGKGYYTQLGYSDEGVPLPPDRDGGGFSFGGGGGGGLLGSLFSALTGGGSGGGVGGSTFGADTWGSSGGSRDPSDPANR